MNSKKVKNALISLLIQRARINAKSRTTKTLQVCNKNNKNDLRDFAAIPVLAGAHAENF